MLDRSPVPFHSHDTVKKHASPPTAQEPCAQCGEETAVGSVFFSDRRSVDRTDGTRTYLCSLCEARLAEGRDRRRLNEKEVRRLVDTYSAVASQITNHHG